MRPTSSAAPSLRSPRQHYPGDFHIILVDDSSDDGTAASPPRPRPDLHVIAARPLPPGWTGKMWAVAEGVPPRPPPTTCCSPTPISSIRPRTSPPWWRAPAHGNYDLVSYMVRLQCRTFAEHALIPAFVFFFFLLYPPAWIRDPRRRTAGAAGGCILIRRAALERIGGIERIRGELIDDCALAREVKQQRRPHLARPHRQRRQHPRVRHLRRNRRMISRTAFTQLRYSASRCSPAPWRASRITYLAPPAADASPLRAAPPRVWARSPGSS